MRAPRHIAQVNIARARARLDDPRMAGFVARLEEINTLAERSAGFVWRLKAEQGDATSVRPYDDERIMINLSVWETPEHLKQYVYRSAHAQLMRARSAWFERFNDVHLAMWWITPGHIPTIAEAKERLHYLQIHGESDYAFSFASLFPMPGATHSHALPVTN